MDSDDDEIALTYEDPLSIRTSNNLDLNVNAIHSSKTETLNLNMEFESDDKAYNFYNKYAELVGFSVRKDWANRSKIHGRVISRKFTCSRQGHRKKDKRDINVKKHRKETRTGCLAHMVITRQQNGKYRVTQIEVKHNHEDVDPSKARKLLEASVSGKGASPEASGSESNTQSKLNLQLLGIRFSPPENYDDFRISDDIFLKSGRTRDMKEGEIARILYYFERQHFKNPSFFYSVQLDIDDRISNIFWADDNMIVDYSHFGDVVCLDTSCTRNVDSRPFVQFIGLNHHRQVVIFGAAFLYDETVNSFRWLFRTFLEAAFGKKPKFVLSDHDATIVQAIHEVLPQTSHYMCVWQMYRIALKHLYDVIKEHDSFAFDLRSCIFCHEHEEDFIQSWDAMLDKHALRHNAWLKWMFREKEKWAVAYGKNSFFIEKNGLHLGELASDKLRSQLSPDLEILEFFKHFESVVNEQRYNELESNFQMGRRAPVLMANAVLLKNPSEIYTPKAFEVFQREYEKSLNVVVTKFGERDSRFDYKAKAYGKCRDFLVIYNTLDGTVSCNCMRFEHVGFLCSHALKVLDHQNIKSVPSYYILNRWMKNSRVLPVKENLGCLEEDNRKIIATRYKDLCRNIVKISSRAAGSDPAFEFAARKLDEVMQGVEKILNLNSYEEGKGTCASENEIIDLDRNDFEGEIESMTIHDKDRLNDCDEQIPSTSGVLNIQPDLVLSVAPAPSVYISSPLIQGLYTVEANHMVPSMYQASNMAINHESNPSLYEPQNFYSNQQHHSPSHAQFLQELLIRNHFQDSMSNGTQLKQVMDDVQHTHTSSFMHYNHRYRASGV